MLNKWIGMMPGMAQGSRPTRPATGSKATRLKWLGLTLGALAIAIPAWAAIAWQTGFEGGALPPTSVLGTEPCGLGTVDPCDCLTGLLTLSTQYKREGSYSGKATLKTCHERAEWREASRPAFGIPRYYGFSPKVPANFDTQRWTIVHQMIQYLR